MRLKVIAGWVLATERAEGTKALCWFMHRMECQLVLEVRVVRVITWAAPSSLRDVSGWSDHAGHVVKTLDLERNW